MKYFISAIAFLFLSSCTASKNSGDTQTTNTIDTKQQLAEIAEQRASDPTSKANNYKKCIENKVIKKPGLTNLHIDGIDISIKGQKIVEIGKTDLKQDVLQAITERFALIDNYLSSTCMDFEREYSSPTPDKKIINKILDQKQTLVLALSNIANDIKATINKEKTQEELKANVENTKVIAN